MISFKNTYRVVITPGEPAGIGPDIVVQLAKFDWPVELVVCADANILSYRAKRLGIPLILEQYQSNTEPRPQKSGSLTILNMDIVEPVTCGKLSLVNSQYVLNTINRACDGCLQGEFRALITGPVHKGIINDSGIQFTGHTEFLAKRSGHHNIVMMLAVDNLRVALATTHIPLKFVSHALTADHLYKVIIILRNDLRDKFAIINPRILVCGLNPHAGENGYIGREEIEIIVPTLNELRRKGILLTGPLPADTIFQPKYLNNADVVLAMYHDQGLTVLKYHGFGRAVNITLGLPFIRTSVDHGTALDLAGIGNSDSNSLITALNLAITMVNKSYDTLSSH